VGKGKKVDVYLEVRKRRGIYFLNETSVCGSLDGICISCEVLSIADTTLCISEQYLFFCHQTGMVGH
jgi:hypothetical protein